VESKCNEDVIDTEGEAKVHAQSAPKIEEFRPWVDNQRQMGDSWYHPCIRV